MTFCTVLEPNARRIAAAGIIILQYGCRRESYLPLTTPSISTKEREV
jgi:hypothetical protein